MMKGTVATDRHLLLLPVDRSLDNGHLLRIHDGVSLLPSPPPLLLGELLDRDLVFPKDLISTKERGRGEGRRRGIGIQR